MERTRYADVAQASGTPASTLQHAFGNLEAMLRATIDFATTRDGAFLASLPSRDSATAGERIAALINGATGTDYGYRAWLVRLELCRAAARDGGLAAETREAYEHWLTATESIVRDGQSAGEFTTDLDARDLATAVLAVLDGCAFSLLLRRDEIGPGETARIALLATTRMLAA